MKSKKKLIIILSIMIAVIGGIITSCSIIATKNESNLITSDGVCSDEVYNDISKAMNTVLFSEDYNNLSLNEKKERMLTVLYELEDKGLIFKDSIFYEDGTICFQYPDGFEGNVRLENRLPGFSGNADTNKYATSWNNSCNEKGAMPKIDFLDSSYPFKEENIKKLNLSAKYMFGLCNENDTSSKDYHDFHRFLTYYKTNQENWNSQYLKTDIDEYCTVEDFKTGLLGYDIVFIELHGTIYKKQPIICTYEEFNNDKYRNDRSHLIIDKDSNGKDYFLIKPSFFEKYYGNNKLNDSIIWIGSCHGYQYDDLAKTFENCGADAVIGYNESVLTDYDYVLHNSFVYSLMHGDTIAESLKFSKGYWKSSDKEWYYAIDSSNKNFFNLIKNYDITLHKSAEAKVNFDGLNAKLIKLVEDKTNEDRLIQMIIYIIESEDTSKLLTDKDVEIVVSNSNLKCVNAKVKTNKEGIVMFEFNTNMQDLVAKTDITLHIDGYQDFIISNYGMNTQGNMPNEVEAFMKPVKVTEPSKKSDNKMGEVKIEDGYLNIRDKPSTKGKIIGKLYNGDIVTIEETSADGKWLKITKGDIKGYVSKDYIKILDETNISIESTMYERITVPTPQEKNTNNFNISDYNGIFYPSDSNVNAYVIIEYQSEKYADIEVNITNKNATRVSQVIFSGNIEDILLTFEEDDGFGKNSYILELLDGKVYLTAECIESYGTWGIPNLNKVELTKQFK